LRNIGNVKHELASLSEQDQAPAQALDQELMVQELVQQVQELGQVPAGPLGGGRTVVALGVRCRFPGRVEVLGLGKRCTTRAPVVAVPGPRDRALAPVLALEVESAAAPGRAPVLALEVESGRALALEA